MVEIYGLDKDILIKMVSHFEVGIAGLGETCGAVIVTVIILGLEYVNEYNLHVGNLIKKIRNVINVLHVRHF